MSKELTIAPLARATGSPLELAASCPELARAVKSIAGGAGDAVIFEHVAEQAQPFLVGLIARAVTAEKKRKHRLWIVCGNTRRQEEIYSELANWFPDAQFFPTVDIAPVEGALPDPEASADRLDLLQRLGQKDGPQVLVLASASLLDEVPSPAGLKQVSLELKRGKRHDRDGLLAELERAGYDLMPQVALRGQYAVRGGIVDVFSWHHPLPVRIEWFDDEVESIRHFDLDAQTSVQHLDSITLLLGEPQAAKCPLRDYIAPGDLLVSIENADESAQVKITAGCEQVTLQEDYSLAFFDHGLGEFAVGDLIVEERQRERFFNQLERWRLDGWRVFIYGNNEGELERLRDLIPAAELDRLTMLPGTVSSGFTFPAAKLAVLSDAELFGRYRHNRARRVAMKRARDQAIRAQIDFSELAEGDYVVHLEHGIGKFRGLRTFNDEEVLMLEFDNDARLYVPLEQSFLVSRYVGVGKRNPQLSALGDGKWAKAKKAAERSVYDYAASLLRLHAERETKKGFAFPPDNKWQNEFERSFLYKETADQLTAIADTKADMESDRPMDRLICGDVGFGKTEVAIRAAFKAVMGGKQVALLVPTTVLAQQHYQNFRERMSDYPITVELLSRYRTPTEQRKTVQRLRDGEVDIVIGTHRLISKDVEFKNLGLVVIDEEQRFGVLHKEKFKELFLLVDVLTLSATPIPRTLYLSLMGAKDMSTLETPPLNRIPTETFICGYDERIIRDAIKRELSRQGQVYFLHNRIESIERIATRIRALVPDAKVEIGHGQMHEHELEPIMQRFVEGATDVLVSTTIIESGLDIPNANTIIIDRADRFGLADLYQLRGRVGRAQHKAYAYLMLPRDMMAVGEARKRINAIKQYSSLGAGFKIAMRDLEIRGAGNVLGTQQSGHIVTIGFDLYCQLLKQAIAKMKGEKTRPRLEVILSLDFLATNEAEWLAGKMTNDQIPMTKKQNPRGPAAASSIGHWSLVIGHSSLAPAFLPATYISESQTRIQAYRQLAELSTQEALDQLRKTWRDRFGPLPAAADNLLAMAAIKVSAGTRKITKVEVKEQKLMLTRGGDYVLIGGKFPRLTEAKPENQLLETLALLRSF
jgi:transcription-repair coupling factor (superfamily II helicase)